MKKILINLVRFYQKYLSRPFANACIYDPSCSQYSIDAIEKYGALKGIKLTILRLIRCRPPYQGGNDPVE